MSRWLPIVKKHAPWMALGVGIWFNKRWNISRWLDAQSLTDFTDLVVDGADFGLFIWLIYLLLTDTSWVWKKAEIVYGFLGGLVLALGLVWSGNFGSWYEIWGNAGLVYLRILGWLYVWRLYRSQADRFGWWPQALGLGVVVSGLVDHYLVSDSLVILLVLSLSQWFKMPKYLRLALGLWLGTLVFTAAWQILTGASLGLIYLGEPKLSGDMLNVAVQEVNGWRILRGYGLTSHPNILGFVGFVLVGFGMGGKVENIWGRYLAWLGSLLVVLSLSRICFLLLLGIFGVRFITGYFKVGWSWIWAGCVGVLLIAVLLTGLSMGRQESDSYRLADLRKYSEIWSGLSWRERAVGLGLGRYSWTVADRLEVSGVWEYQPVHNVWLLLLAEWGLLGWLWIVGYLANITALWSRRVKFAGLKDKYHLN